MTNLDVEQDWREVLASKASKWNKKSRRLSHLTISTHSPPPRSRSPADDNMSEMEMDDGSSWSETESSVSTGFSRSVRSKSTTLSVYSGISCSSQDELDLDARDEASFITLDDDDDVSTTSEVQDHLEGLMASSPQPWPCGKWVEDDLGLRSFPTKHVDYLSHDWREVDIWASWRHLVSKKTSYNNEKRLINACWRVWGKMRSDLKTVTPESLNWLKDCDVTWLYGPLQPGPTESLRAMSLDVMPTPLERHNREEMLDLKPILKRRSGSEKMLQRSLSAASLLKQATAAIEAERSARAREAPFLPLKERGRSGHKFVRPTTPNFSRSPSAESIRPLMSPGVPDKKRIHFQEQVEQCIALENSESESDSRGMASDPDTDSEGSMPVMTKAPLRRWPSIPRRPNRHAERRKNIIAKLPSTTLNCGDEDADLVASFWRGSKTSPSLPSSPGALSPSLPATNFLLDDADDESEIEWSPSKNKPSIQSHLTGNEVMLNDDLSFPCLVCNESPDRNYRSRNDWLVHLWTVHQDPSTWVSTSCLWEGCKTHCKFDSAETWLIHVYDTHKRQSILKDKAPNVVGLEGMPAPAPRPQGPKLKFTLEDDALLVDLKENKSLTWKQIADFFPGRTAGTLQVRYCTKFKAGTVQRTEKSDFQNKSKLQSDDIAVLRLAKDIGSLIVHTAGDPLAAILEKLSGQYKASMKDQQTPGVDLLYSDDAEYIRDLVQRNIDKISLNDHPVRYVEDDHMEASLVGRLAQLLSLRGEHVNGIVGTADQDLASNAEKTTPVTRDHREASASISALYSLVNSIRRSLVSSKTLPNTSESKDTSSEEHHQDSSDPFAAACAGSQNFRVIDECSRPSVAIRSREESAINLETNEYQSTEYDSSELEDLPSDLSASGDLSDESEESLECQDNGVSNFLEPMQQALVDRVMDEFWTIFNQNWDSGFRECAGTSHTSSSPSNSTIITSAALTPSSTQQRKRQRDSDKASDDEDGNMSRRPKRSTGPSEDSRDRKRFACPFRKHDARRYSTYSYRVCALSHWETIARVKEHIYRCHRMPVHCKRCWKQFKNQELLDSHLTVDIGAMCELKNGTAPDGITTEQERRLRSRKKSSPNQSDEGRWREIYQVLFPNEEVPSPYFEPVQDEIPPGSPDARDLANYEDYMRRELPRLVRTNIEDVVRRDMQPLEAALIGNLVDIIQDCQDRLFRGYRQMRGEGTDASVSPAVPSLSFSPSFSENSIPNVHHQHGQSQLLESAFQPPPPSNLDLQSQVLNQNQTRTNNLHHEPSLDMILSDSGYASEMPHFCDCQGLCSCGTFNAQTRDGGANLDANNMFAFEEPVLNGLDTQWDGWDLFPSWDALNSVGGGFDHQS